MTTETMMQAIEELRAYRRDVDDPFADLGIEPTFFEVDGRFCLSAEDGKCFADYYMEFNLHARSSTPGVDPDLCEIANRYGCFWEWLNPGAAVLAC